MRYQGSEALDMEFAERGAALEREAARPSFEVVPGGGLDARARRGVSAQFLANAKTILKVAAVVLIVGMVRVALTTATVSTLKANSSLRSAVEDAQNLNDDLKIERAVLSSNSRISRIATQNYGMALSSDAVSVDLSADAAASQGTEAQDEAVAADAADTDTDTAATDSSQDDADQQASDEGAQDASEDAAAYDGDAAQPADDAPAYADVA